MKPHPRIRKTIMWTGAAATLLLALTWAATGWWWISLLPTQQHWLSAKSGTIALSDDPLLVQMSALLPKLTSSPPPPPDRFQWWLSESATRKSGTNFGIAKINTRTRTLTILLWPLVVIAAGATIAAWRLDVAARRRQRAHACPKCNYDRTGLTPDAKCPECGTFPPTV